MEAKYRLLRSDESQGLPGTSVVVRRVGSILKARRLSGNAEAAYLQDTELPAWPSSGIRFTGRTPTARDRLPLAAQQLGELGQYAFV